MCLLFVGILVVNVSFLVFGGRRPAVGNRFVQHVFVPVDGTGGNDAVTHGAVAASAVVPAVVKLVVVTDVHAVPVGDTDFGSLSGVGLGSISVRLRLVEVDRHFGFLLPSVHVN